MLSSGDIRAMLRRGEATVGTWLQIPSPDAAEVIGRLGYDWPGQDMEHGAFTRAHLPDMFRALERWGTLPFVRLPEATMRNIKDALDSGAQGLIFPMIESRAQLDRAIAWSLYPGGAEFGDGRRGVGFSRANAYGLDFAEQANAGERQGRAADIVLVAQIEHRNALDQLDAIFSHPRLDACMVGPYDLSASMNLTGRFDQPEFLAALAAIEERAAARGLARGYHVVQPDSGELRRKIAAGYTFLAYGLDTLFLRRGGARPEV
ncbi:MAG: 2,4-dihydroxyhept-2-ene-1,7-dioic acid aldolase [Desulfovibrio sp.]|nr:2,4-dihydroxyhept-2-ene-1,7-dioic acid aldolase [Desulfovibrio sp.]